MRNEHVISVESSFLSDGVTAVCSCGWRGETRESTADAGRDGQAHVASVADRAAREDRS